LVMPLTYMNRSGVAIEHVLEQEGVGDDKLLVVCDDINLPLGQLRLRGSGSAGGHNGLASIIERLDSDDFDRLRLGVGGPPGKEDLADFVLDRFAEDERGAVDEMTASAIDAVRLMLTDGIGAAMTVFNRRKGSAESGGAQED